MAKMIDYPEVWGRVRLPSENEQNLAYFLKDKLEEVYGVRVEREDIEAWVHEFYDSIP